MRYFALATDYDGTLADKGHVDEPTLKALRRLKETGRRLILVTGRELDELLGIFPEIDLFDRVVAENGALLYRPETKEERPLAPAPPAEFSERLKSRGVERISVGRVIVATWEPHQAAVLETIREMGLELQVIFNKGAVMILPSGVNKASGLAIALEELQLSPHNTVSIGDAENDQALLAFGECGVAVSNALDSVKERVDWVTEQDHGAGVVALIDRLEADDLAELEPKLSRHHVLLGKREDDAEVRIPPYCTNILVAGTSGSGKSTLTTGILERLAGAKYQFAIIDPEGDYTELEFAVVLGDSQQAPSAEGVVDLLAKPEVQNVAVNLLGLPMAERPRFSDGLLPRLQELQAATGRPHWLIFDEVHHLMPSAWQPGPAGPPQERGGTLAITVHPASVARRALDAVNLVLAVGEHPERTIREFCEATGRDVPGELQAVVLEKGETLLWCVDDDEPPYRVRTEPPKSERRRHGRKYAEGNLGPDRSFYFRGPDGSLKLRAQNLMIFLQIAGGLDDATWSFHLQQGDYARWFRDQIKDDELAEEAEAIAAEPNQSAEDGRARIRKIVEARYTLPAEPEESVTDPSKFG